MKKKLFALLALALSTMSASAYELKVGTNEHGTVTFKVGETSVTSAQAGDEVIVTVKAGKGWKSKDLTARAFTSFEAAQAPRRNAPANIELLDWLTVTPSAEADSVYTFTMPAANVEVYAGYDHRALTNDMIRAIGDQVWTGSAVKPNLVVVDRNYTLVEGTDYTVSYTDNVDKGVNTATATITAKNDIEDYYIGTASANFSIRKTIAYANGFTAYAVSDEEHPIVYTGSPLEPQVVVRESRVTLVKDVDYTLEYRDNTTATSPGQFVVTGIGQYDGELTGYFTINTRDLSSEMITPVTGIVYDGTPQYPHLTITYNGNVLVEGDDTNPRTCDYYTTYSDNTEPGEAIVKIEGVNNFSGTFNYTFNIGAKELTADMIGAVAAQTYDGNAKEPAPVVTYNGMTLTPGTDYTVSYADNTDAGTATLTITSTAANTNYTGSASKEFTIQKANASVTDPTVRESLVYTAEAQPLLNAGTVEGGEMQYSLDGETWTPSVSTGTDAGSYTVYYKTVGDKNHKDVAAKSLTVGIAKADLTTMTLAETTFTYNRAKQTAKVSSVSAGTISVSAENYTVSGNMKTNVGVYTAKVTAKSASKNFTGSATAQWSIVEADAQLFAITLAPTSYVYDGTEKLPAVTVKDGSAVLVENSDYTLSYENNVGAGTAKVTATGMGNYSGTKEAAYTIQKANSSVTAAPVARDLSYNYESQALVTAGACSGGTMVYSLDGENFSDAVPSVESAGSYTVYYKVQGDANHNDTEVSSLPAAIGKSQGTMAFENNKYELIYGDANFTNTVEQYGDNGIRFVSSDPRVAEVHYYTGEVEITGVGECTITAMMVNHTNFVRARDISYTVSVAQREVTDENVTLDDNGGDGVPEVYVSLEAPVGTLTPQEGVDYQVSYYDQDENTVTVDEMIANPGEYTMVLTFFGNYDGFVEKSITVNNVTFDETEDNSYKLYDYDGYEAGVVLKRTLEPGMWNSFAAPFDISGAELSARGITAKELTASSFDSATGILSMTFADAAAIAAGRPYLVKVSAELADPTFAHVIITDGERETQTDAVDFVPTLGRTLVSGSDGNEDNPLSVLFLGSSNQLLYPTVVNDSEQDASYIMGFRAYFRLKGEAVSAVRSFKLNNLDGESTGISLTPNRSALGEGSGYHSLDGRKLQGQPTTKGVYVVNGKKVIIK